MYAITFINNRYFLFTLILYLILGLKLEPEYSLLYFYNFCVFIVYFLVLRSQTSKANSFYTTSSLILIISIMGFLSIVGNNFISYAYNENFFVFSEADARVYHNESIVMSQISFVDSINYFLNYWSFEDLGAVLVISSIYRFFISNLMVNMFYLILSIFSAFGILKIAAYLMPIKYAYWAALTFSISSFYIWFNSSGLKESVMIFLTIYTFLQYYHFINRKSIKYIFFSIPFLLLLMLFRPAVVVLIIGSILVSFLFARRKGSVLELFVIMILIIGMITGYSSLVGILDRFIGSGGVARMIEMKELDGMVKGSIQFTYMVNILAGLIGPLPTLLPNLKPILSIYAPGLIYKSLISIPFLFGIYTIYKRNLYLYFPILIFVLIESSSLVLILEGLELRKSMPHFPFIYIISFGFMSYLDSNTFFNYKQRRMIYNLLRYALFGVFMLIFYWNLRF